MNQQRAVYQPLLENVPGYDLSDDEAEEERSRLPLLIVIALIVLAAFAGVVWLAYNQGVARGRTGAQVVVAAPDGPVRTGPTDAGGAPTPYLGLKVYQDPLPPDAEAQSSSLAQSTLPGVPAEITQAAPVPPPTTEAPPARFDPAPPPVAAPAPPPARIAVAAPPPAAPRQLAAPPPAAAAPLPPATPPVAAAPAPAPVAAAAPKPAPAAAPKPAPASATSGGALLQVGAYESEEIANTAFTRFQARFGAVAGTLSPNVQKADLGAKGIWYRLRVGPFADRAAAASACEKLKAAGGTCLVAAP